MVSVAVVLAACGRVGFDATDDVPDSGQVLEATQLDETFGTAGVALTSNGIEGVGYGILPRANGGAVVVGSATVNSAIALRLTAWDAAGRVDTSYGVDGSIDLKLAGDTYGYGARRFANGRGAVWGDGLETTGQEDDMVYALLDEQDLPTTRTFNIDVQADDTANSLVPRPGGGFVMCGVANRDNFDSHYALVFVDEAGVLDAAIGSNGVLYDDETTGDFDRCWDMVVDAEGRFVTAGTGDEDLLITRHLVDGERDPTFGVNGRLVIPATAGEGLAIAIAPDGDIVLAGQVEAGGIVVRADGNGQLRTTFGDGGVVTYLVSDGADPSDVFIDVAVQANGKIIAAGIHDADGNSDGELVRFDADGSLDSTFGVNGAIRIDRTQRDMIYSVVIAPDGSILATGAADDTTWLIKVR